jgi:N-(5-amino-5-carboxypentanoyl)-L-cysteinyl-D-valine synthase
LKSTKLSFAASKALGAAVSVTSLFRHPTVEALAHWIVNGSTDLQVVAPLEELDLVSIPVSPAQQRLLFIDQFGGRDAYNIALHFELHQGVDLDSMQKAIYDMVTRHEALRTVFVQDSQSHYCQRILTSENALSQFSLDISHLQDRTALDTQMTADSQTIFKLDAEIPFKAHLYKLDSACFASFVFHHAAFDAWSWNVFQRDLEAYYEFYRTGEKVTDLPTLRVQYKEYAVEHCKALYSERYRSLVEFWSRKISGTESLHIPTDRPRPAQFDHSGHDIVVQLNSPLTQKLRELSRQQGTSVYTVMLSAYCYLLNCYTGRDDVSLGIPVSHRSHPEFESVVGFFVNLLPLRLSVTQSTFYELISSVQKEVLEAQIHQDMPFQDIIKLLHVPHDASSHPLVQTVFNWESMPTASANNVLHEYLPEPMPSAAKFDLSVTVKEKDDSLLVNFNYARSLFGSSTIQGFADTYVYILEQITDSGDVKLASVSFPEGGTDSASPISKTSSADSTITESLAELFEHQVAVSPSRVALVDNARSMTYAELNAEANQLAWWMMTYKKIEADDRIALVLDKGIYTIICILAVWKVGAAYVPLDPSYPTSRLQFILEDTSAKILLTTSKHIDKFQFSAILQIAVDAAGVQSSLNQQSSENLAIFQNPSSLAYVIYTSGTTGKPKGVLVEQRSVARFRDAIIDRYFGSTNGSHSILFLSNYIFDFSVEQFSLSFLSGNKLVIPPEEGLTSEEFYNLANAEQLSYISGTPSVLQQIHLSRLQHLQVITAAGEEFYRSQYESLRAQFNGLINNAYGITETTVYNLVTSFAPSASFSKPLRDELQGSRAFVLNDRLQRVPVNAVGELYLAGDCVSRGYLNRDTLTKERFIPSPFATSFDSTSFDRLYKTGDLVRYHGPQQFEYLGRRDQQVKLRGFRIELAEVRDALGSLPEVKESSVIPQYDKEDPVSRSVTGLIGYYVLKQGMDVDTADIHAALAALLPQFMIPSRLCKIESALPVTVNGKLDTARLAAMEFSQNTQAYCSPRNVLDVKLCQLWASTLRMYHCGIDDDFFTQGGDSISLLKLIGDINRNLGFKVTAKDIFLNRTVRALHDNVLSQKNSNALLPPLKADQCQIQGESSLLPIQKWFLSKDLQDPQYWNHCFTIKTPELDVNILQKALQELHERHDMLRMRLHRTAEGRIQTFPTGDSVQLHEICTQSTKPSELNETLSQLQSTFDLENGTLYAVAYISGYEDGSARVWFSLHHLIVDTVSWEILRSDLQTLYHSGNLGMKTSSYQQWSAAINSYAMTSAERSHWESLRERTRHTRLPRTLGTSRVNLEAKLGQTITNKLIQKCAATLGASMHDILLMAVGFALQQITEGLSIVTLEGHGREGSVDSSLDVSRTLGWFTTMYPFQIPEITDLAQGVLDVQSAVRRVPNNGVGYGTAYDYFDGYMPSASVNYLGQLDQGQSSNDKWQLAVGEGEYRHGLHTSARDANKSSSAVDITLSVIEGQLDIQIDSLLEGGNAQQLLQGIQSALEGVVEQVSKANFKAPHNESQDEFIPYVIFDEDSRKGAPLFMLPPGEGGAESYFRNIVQELPCRKLAIFNNHYREVKTLMTIEDLADYYLAHIREIQPQGPYDLLGWSFGAILALEIVKRLASDGQSIGTLTLIDPYFDVPSATEAIDQGNNAVLDPIYHIYQPAVDGFKVVEAAQKITLFKATESNDQHGNSVQQQLYEWFAHCEANNLDKYLSKDTFEVVPLKGTHFTWVQDMEQVKNVCRVVEGP